VYERADGRVYARELGSTERILIGEEYSLDTNQRRMQMAADWMPIVEAAEHNPALQDALERVKLIYELGKKDDNNVQHHPV